MSVVPAETSWWWDGAAASVQMAGATAAAARRRAAAAGAEVQPTRGGAQRARREQQNVRRGGARDGSAEQQGGPRDDEDGRVERRSALGGAHAAAEEARANICGVSRCERSAVNVTTPLCVQKARILATYVRLVKRDDDRLAAARSRGGRARMRWRQGARLAVAWAPRRLQEAVDLGDARVVRAPQLVVAPVVGEEGVVLERRRGVAHGFAQRVSGRGSASAPWRPLEAHRRT